MKLVKSPLFRFTPAAEMERWNSRIRELLGEPFDGGLFPTGWTPATEIEELDNEYQVTVELPGVKPEAIDIEYENGILTITGETKEEFERKEPQLLAWERYYGTFQRSFMLPKGVDVDKVKASFTDGVLKVKLPKTEKARGKKIALESKP
jgi:HSP20 family protein